MQGFTLKQQMQFLATNLFAAKLNFEEGRNAFLAEWIVIVILANRGNKVHAARDLGMHRNTLDRWIKALNIDMAEIRKVRHDFAEERRKTYQGVANFERRKTYSASA